MEPVKKFHLLVPLNAFYILKKGLGLPDLNSGVILSFPNFGPAIYVFINQLYEIHLMCGSASF
jgi:hypothetical protein